MSVNAWIIVGDQPARTGLGLLAGRPVLGKIGIGVGVRLGLFLGQQLVE